MKAAVWTNYGVPEVLQVQELAQPQPKADEVRIRVMATTVETGDCEVRAFKMHNALYSFMRLYFGLIRPRGHTILGQQFAGVVDAVGEGVSRFREGDKVFGTTGMRFGAYAEYLCLPEQASMVPMPANVSFTEAAPLAVSGLNALHFLRMGNVQQGTRLLIYGSSGSIGSAAVQLAKHMGAEVTAVCSGEKMELVQSLGADQLIDYTREDFTRSGKRYEVIFDTIGKSPFAATLQSLEEDGIYLQANPTLREQLRGLWNNLFSRRRYVIQLAEEPVEDLLYLKERVEEGSLHMVIDRSYTLEQIAEAHHYVEQRRKRGNVVINLAAQGLC